MCGGELVDLDADAKAQIGASHWLRIPLGNSVTTATWREIGCGPLGE
jgi:hypothetical protein